VLLDEKRTKRIVRIVAILTSIAFAGVGVVVIALVIFGGTPTASEQLVKDARSRVKAEPDNPDAWNQLAAALQSGNKTAEAVDAGKKAVQLAPKDFRQTQVLVTIYAQAGRTDDALAALQQFTRRNPKEPQAFLQLGQLSQQAGKNDLARLSYQAYLGLNSDGATADAVRNAIKDLSPGAGSTVTTTP